MQYRSYLTCNLKCGVYGEVQYPRTGTAETTTARHAPRVIAKLDGPHKFNPGGDLRSHTVTRAVSSALRGLTSVFGMGTGVTPAVKPPETCR